VEGAAEVQIDVSQRFHNAIFSVRLLPFTAMRWLLAVLVAAAVVPAAGAASPGTRLIKFDYRAHNGVMRPAWLLLPSGYDGGAIPLVISPHGRGVSGAENARFWGDLPGEGGFAVVNPGGEGRRLGDYSWGDPGQISDLARMPAIVERHGVHVDPHRIYAIGGSMGGQETLLLVARDPQLLAGAIAFDPATDMARRYRDFARLRGGRLLQSLARRELGGTPASSAEAYRARSPDDYLDAIAYSGVPLQIYWSMRDRIIADQPVEAALLAADVRSINPAARLWDFEGAWRHTAEMQSTRRLPRALARFGLLPWRDAPALPVAATRVPAPNA
jgi:pimeloyl-ACP methyl ester carboxylesterase